MAGADTMAASAVASEPAAAPAPPALKFHLATAAVLLAALVAAHAVFELSRPEKILVEGPLEMPAHPASVPPPEDAPDGAVRFTPEIDIDGPTTVVFELERSAMEGWVGVGIALVHRTSGAVRRLALGTDWIRPIGGDPSGSLHASARVDRVSSGSYVVRLEPAWEPARPPLPGRAEEPGDMPDPPAATIRIRQERRSPLNFWVAAALVVLPALVQIGRRLWYTRRHGAEMRRTGREE